MAWAVPIEVVVVTFQGDKSMIPSWSLVDRYTKNWWKAEISVNLTIRKGKLNSVLALIVLQYRKSDSVDEDDPLIMYYVN
jgi:hypothetical protein